MTKFKAKVVAVAAGACAALGFSAPASAYVYGLSHLSISGLSLTFADDASTIGSFQFRSTNTASINDISGPTGQKTCNSAGPNPGTCGGSPVLDAQQSIAPGSNLIKGENDYSFATPAQKLVNSFSRSDSIIRSAELVNGVPTNVEQIAESLLNATGTASANSQITSTTSLTASGSFTGDVSLSFMADVDQSAEIGGGSTGISSQSVVNATFTLTQSGTNNTIKFTPTGSGNSDCVVSGFAGVSCSVTGDSMVPSLNSTISVAAPGQTSNGLLTGFSMYGISIMGLASNLYSISFSTLTSTDISAEVPEPGNMALVGAALAALGWTTSRRKRKSVAK